MQIRLRTAILRLFRFLSTKKHTSKLETKEISFDDRYREDSLSFLAMNSNSDKGPRGHRYTEIYDLLFYRVRLRKLNVLEIGLQIGGPEHGKPPERQTSDLPSIKLWLEYFPNAHIYGADVSDFTWFMNDRFSFLRCDLDKLESIVALAASLPRLDLIVDDASHASHHQQRAFLELFPILNPGGLYVIEDLQWQPRSYEITGITRTEKLFEYFLKHNSFSHAFREYEEKFNKIRNEICGVFLFQEDFIRYKKNKIIVIQKK